MKSDAPIRRAKLRDLLAAYLDYQDSLNLSINTLKGMRYNNLRFLGWLENTHRVRYVDQLRRRYVPGWLRYLASYRTSRGRVLKASSVNKQIECVRGFTTYLASQGHVNRSLTDAFQYVKEPRFLPKGVLTHAQVQALVAAVDTTCSEGYRDRTIMELLYSSGIRVSELLGLNLGDVDFQNQTALVMGKGRKQRVVPIGQTALRYLEGYVVGVRSHLVRSADEQAVFLDNQGQRMPYHTLRRNLHAYAGRVGLEVPVTPHTFRRSCTTEMLRGGANMYHVKEMLGHESLDTLKHYARLTITDLKKTHAKCHPRELEND